MNLPSQLAFATVIEPSNQGKQQFDIYSRLLAERIIFLQGEITEEKANLIVAQMLFLDAEDPDQDITLYINSSGSSFTAALTIYDAMTQLRTDICTVSIGTAAATALFLLSSGTKGKRYALPNVRISIRQPLGSAEGKATEIEAVAKEIMHLRQSINRIMAANTGQSIERIELDSQRDFFMNAEEAKDYGLVDTIIRKN
jgi:ATP-dependent Clp protease, protease subunit